MPRFDGQVAIITGSGRGLGAAYAHLLAERGASVVVHDAGVTLDGTGFDPQVADAVVHDITTKRGIAVPCYENIESQASNNQFSTVQWKTSTGVDFGETIATPEAIADQWNTIIGA